MSKIQVHSIEVQTVKTKESNEKSPDVTSPPEEGVNAQQKTSLW